MKGRAMREGKGGWVLSVFTLRQAVAELRCDRGRQAGGAMQQAAVSSSSGRVSRGATGRQAGPSGWRRCSHDRLRAQSGCRV